MLVSVQSTPKVKISPIFPMLVFLIFTNADLSLVAKMKPEEMKRLMRGSLKRKVSSSSIDAQKKPKTSNKSHKKGGPPDSSSGGGYISFSPPNSTSEASRAPCPPDQFNLDGVRLNWGLADQRQGSVHRLPETFFMIERPPTVPFETCFLTPTWKKSKGELHEAAEAQGKCEMADNAAAEAKPKAETTEAEVTRLKMALKKVKDTALPQKIDLAAEVQNTSQAVICLCALTGDGRPPGARVVVEEAHLDHVVAVVPLPEHHQAQAVDPHVSRQGSHLLLKHLLLRVHYHDGPILCTHTGQPVDQRDSSWDRALHHDR